MSNLPLIFKRVCSQRVGSQRVASKCVDSNLVRYVQFLERNFKMNNLTLNSTRDKKNESNSKRLCQLLKRSAPTLMVAGILTLLMGTGALAQVDGVDKVIKGVADSVLPNFKFGTGVVSGTLGLGIAIAGLLKTSPRMLMAGAALAIIPATLWDSVVGGAATILIP